MITKQIWPIEITEEIYFFMPFIRLMMKSKKTKLQREAIQCLYVLSD